MLSSDTLRTHARRGPHFRGVASAVTGLLLVLHGVAAAQDAALTAAVEKRLGEEGLVGAVWATAHPDSGVKVGAAGRRQAGRPERLSPEHRVQIGSVTKTLLAAGVLHLVTDGRIELDAPVARYLPDLRIANPWAGSRPLRVRHLLDHTSGLDDARLWQLFGTDAGPDTPLRAGFHPRRLRLALRHPPGERFSYSNTGYGLLALVVEAVAGERYETYLDTHLLRPLGMESSTFRFVTQRGPYADPGLAMGHFEEGALAPAVPTYLRPAMQFTTTAADMGRFALFLLGEGTVDGRRLVHDTLLRAMGAPAGTEAARAGLPAGYGLGLSRRDRGGVLGRCHAGNTVGYRAMFCLYPDQKKAFFIAMNADSEDANYVRIDSLIVASLRLTPQRVAPVHAATLNVGEWEGFYVPSPARFEMFAYLDVLFGFMRVRAERGRAVLQDAAGERTALEPVGGALFRAPGRTLASHALLAGERGPVISDGLRTYERASLGYLVPLWASLACGLFGLLYILLRGIVGAVRRRLRVQDPVFALFLVTIAGGLTGVLLAAQPVLRMGDPTPANTFLALVSAALPVASAAGLWLAVRAGLTSRTARADAAALAATLQWFIVLACWGLLPLTLWR